jgi:hypothetical protein
VIVREMRSQHLDGDISAEPRVACAIDRSHAPAPSGATIS